MSFDNTKMVVEEIFSEMRRCSKCLLPETFPGIKFDEEGVCNYCCDYKQIEVYGEEALIQILLKYRNKGAKYDALVPISGGRDSSFVLHQMVKKYKMRVLALTIENGAITMEGYRNIKKITEVLDVDHVWINDENKIKLAKKNVKLKFHAWLKKPSINTIVPVLNAGDKTMNLQLFNYAKDHKIPLLLGGNNIGNSSIEQEYFKTGFLGVFPDYRGYYSTYDSIKLFFLFGLEYLSNYRNLRWSIFKEYIDGAIVYFFESFIKPDSVTPLGFYDYIYWNEKEILSTIRNELGWKGAADTSATWRVDDAAYPLIDYLYYNLVGFTEFDELYSRMVREGQISRDEALKRCFSDNTPRRSYLGKMFEELETYFDEVDEVLEQYREKLLRKINYKY